MEGALGHRYGGGTRPRIWRGHEAENMEGHEIEDMEYVALEASQDNNV